MPGEEASTFQFMWCSILEAGRFKFLGENLLGALQSKKSFPDSFSFPSFKFTVLLRANSLSGKHNFKYLGQLEN